MKKAVILSLILSILVVFSYAVLSCAGSEAAERESSDGSYPLKEGAGEDREKPKPGSAEKDSAPAEAALGGSESESEKKESARGAASDASEEEMTFMAEDEESDGTPKSKGSGGDTSKGRGARGSTPSVSGLKAGFADDNKQYGYFVDFLEEYSYAPHLQLPVGERIVLQVKDRDEKPIPNADVLIAAGGRRERGKTMADGSFLFFPSLYPEGIQSFDVTVRAQQQEKEITFPRTGERIQTVTYGMERYIPKPIPLDILFIFDTTGSMGDEIDRLKTTIELIHINLTNLSIHPTVRFGMVLYKDIGDEYRTKVVPLTADLEEFQEALDQVEASGGGDTPEDLQAALEDAVTRIEWEPEGIRLGFIITDAPPHLDYGQEYTYVDASKEAKEKGIKIFSVGTGGLDISGEYVLRQISQFTSGKYIFLTYGETGESEGGRPGAVSHHTGSNFQTDKLEAIIIRFAKEELSNLTDEPIQEEEPYFVAEKIDEEEREETLSTLFSMALDQLLDYSTFSVEEGTPSVLLPLISQEEGYEIDAEYFTEQLMQQAIRNDRFRLVERQDLQSILDELKLQLSGLTDNTQAAKVGELMHADLMIGGTVFKRKDNFELFLKLLRVESGEILSITKAQVDRELGLSDN